MNKHLRPRALLLALASAVTAYAQPAASTSLEDRLARLEAQLARLEARLGDTVSVDELAPTLKDYSDLSRQLGWDGKTPLNFVKVAGKEKSFALGGFAHALFEAGKAPDARYTGINNRFYLRRARLFTTGTFAENFSFKVEADFGNNSIATKSGISGQLTDAFFSWTKNPAASVRVGQFKTPFGYEQLASDTKILTIERALPNDRLTLGRQVGAMVYGDLLGKKLSYSLATYNGTGTNISSNDNQKFLWVGRVAGVLVERKIGEQKLRIGAGVNRFESEDKGAFTGRRFGSGLDAQVSFGPAELQAEWLVNEQHPFSGAPIKSEGWALLGAYTMGKWQGVARFETYDSNTALSATTTDVWTLGVNFLIKGDDLKLSLNYLSGDQPGSTVDGGRVIGRLQVMF